MAEGNDICSHCGAPRVPGFAACKYCKTIFSREAQTSIRDNAVPCPQCQILNEWGAQRCIQCQSWVVVQCVFCHGLSPHHIPACLTCNEPFAGAPERLAMQREQQTSEQRMQMVGTVGGVAASFLGAMAGSAIAGGGSHVYHQESHHHYGRQSWSESEQEWGQSDSSAFSTEDAGGGGGGLLDSLMGGGSSDDSSSNFSTDDAGGGDGGGGGGGLLDELIDGGSSSDE